MSIAKHNKTAGLLNNLLQILILTTLERGLTFIWLNYTTLMVHSKTYYMR